MIIKFSRYIIISFIIIVSSVYIPHYYRLLFYTPTSFQYVLYSSLLKEVMIYDKLDEEKEWKSVSGKRYTRSESDSLMPLFNYRALMLSGKMPKAVGNIKIDAEQMQKEYFALKINGSSLNRRLIPLFPLFETASANEQPEWPKELFRIGKKMEFINCRTNSINIKKSTVFTEALKKSGFIFPAHRVFLNPSVLKPYDSGVFMEDHPGNIFHLKSVNGKPIIVKTDIADNKKIKSLIIREIPSKQFWGFAVTEDNELFAILTDNYRLKKIELPDYDSDRDHIYIRGNLLYRVFTCYHGNEQFTVVTDRQFNPIDSYDKKWSTWKETISGKIFSLIFPFALKLKQSNSIFADLYVDSVNYKSLYLNVALLLLYIVRKYRNGIKLNYLDLSLIALTGIYGFVAVTIIRPIDEINKEISP